MRALAIDFGTATTVAMLRWADGRTRPLLFDGSPLLPSAVHVAADGATLVGREAERAGQREPAGFEPHPKRRIDEPTVLLAGQRLAVPTMVAAVLARVAAQAGTHLRPGAELRLTHPAGWGPRRRAVLVDAADRAGLPAARLVAEPVAAAAYYTAVLGGALPAGRALAVYDLGAASFDAAVVRRTAAGFEVLAADGLATLGGLDLDHALVEHLRRAYPGTAGQWDRLLHPADDTGRRLRAQLYEDVRAARQTLSGAPVAELHLPLLDERAQLTRDELEQLVRPHLAQTVECLARAIDAAGLTPARLAGVFLVGGASRTPLAAQLIYDGLAVAPTILDQPETVLAEGALYLDPPPRRRPGGTHSGIPRVVATAPAPPHPAAPLSQPGAPLSQPAVPQPRAAPPAAATGPWYAEPVILATLLVFILVVAAAAVLVSIV